MISAIYVESGLSINSLDLPFLSLISRKFTSWQGIFSSYLESFSSPFCTEVLEAESVNLGMKDERICQPIELAYNHNWSFFLGTKKPTNFSGLFNACP
jgi:hypothetical protein